MLYSEVVRSNPLPSFNTYPIARKKRTRNSSPRQVMLEEKQTDTDDRLDHAIAKALAAMQQVRNKSPTSQEKSVKKPYSSAWEIPVHVYQNVSETPVTRQDPIQVTQSPPVRSNTQTYQASSVTPAKSQTFWYGSIPCEQEWTKRQPVPVKQQMSQTQSIPWSSHPEPRRYRSNPPQKKSPRKETEQYDVQSNPDGRWQAFIDSNYDNRMYWEFIPHAKEVKSKPKPKVPKKKTTFLSLPGELRNQIYAEVLPECRILILRSRPNKELDILKKSWSASDEKRSRARLYHKLDNGQIADGLEMTTNLLLACRAVKKDVELYLYSRTTFCFDSMKVFNQFTRQASFDGIQAIEKLEISHNGYGNPQLTDNDTYQVRYYDRWSKLCKTIGEKLTGLKHLKVHAHLRQWPSDMSELGPGTQWRKAFLQMAPRRLEKVELVLEHGMCNSKLMKEMAYKLEGDMMTDEGGHQRDLLETKRVLAELEAKKAAKRARRLAAQAKANAPTELFITMDQVMQQNAAPAKADATAEPTIMMNQVTQQNGAPIKYRSTGLEKYSRVMMSEMCPAELYQFKENYCSGKYKK